MSSVRKAKRLNSLEENIAAGVTRVLRSDRYTFSLYDPNSLFPISHVDSNFKASLAQALSKIYKPAFVDFFVKKGYRPSYYWESTTNTLDGSFGSILVGLALNEFLAQDSHEKFGDFFEESWDSLMESMSTLSVNWYSHSDELFTELTAFGFTPLAKTMTASVFTGLNILTKKNAMQIIKERGYVSKFSKTFVRYVESKKAHHQVKASDVSNDVYKLIASFMAEDDSETRLRGVYALMTERMFMAVTESMNDSYCGAKYPLPEDVHKLVKYFTANSELFSLKVVFAILNAICMHTSYCGSGSAAASAEFLASVTEKENSHEIFEAIAWLILAHNEGLPTITEWERALKEGDLDSILDPVLLASIIAKPSKRKITGDLERLRSVFMVNGQ